MKDKYRIISLISIFIIIVIGIIFSSKKISFIPNKVFHEHLERQNQEEKCEGIDNCSHLAILNIDTHGQEIPTKKQDIKFINVDMEVYDNKDGINILGKDPENYKLKTRYRGRSSLYFEKKGYNLKFLDEKGKNTEVSLLGMPAANKWALHGPFLDRTQIRNYMWYNIGQEIMGYAPKTRFLELYVNSKYKGLYVAIESVTIGEKSRVRINPYKKNSIATSYILLMDTEEGTEKTNLNTFTKYTYTLPADLNLIIEYPSEDKLNKNVRKYIYDDYNKFEKMLYSYDYHELVNYIDIDSFVDYFIINEFTVNYDAGSLSTYIYKDIFGKYKMYIWDFNSANNNYHSDFLMDQKFDLNNNIWYLRLLKDEEFVDAIINRYKELRKSYLSEEYLMNYIDETIKYLGKEVDKNFEVWDYSAENDGLHSNFNPKNYDEAIWQLKNAIKIRGDWMDKNIETLKQYSHPSKNKKYNK